MSVIFILLNCPARALHIRGAHTADNTKRPAQYKTAIVTIATGGYRADQLVGSLRDPQRGNWQGKIYLYSDECAPPVPTTRRLNVTRAGRLRAKQLKMRILNDTDTAFEYLLFLDSDIEVTGSMDIFFDTMPAWDDACDVYMPHDVWYSNNFVYNAGTFLLRRSKSEQMMKLWYDRTTSKEYMGNKDQPAIAQLIASGDIRVCTLPDRLVHYSTDVFNRWSAHTALFTHYLTKKTNVHRCRALRS